MIFEEFSREGCRSYLIGCEESRVAAIIDPVLQRAGCYAATASRHGLGSLSARWSAAIRN